MEILVQLGANSTAFIQFVLFVITISFLTIFVFSPFFKAYDKRVELTKGADQVAAETLEEATKLEQVFKARAREINEKIKNIFDQSKNQADSAASSILTQSKDEAAKQTEAARADLEKQKQSAVATVGQVAKDVAAEISKKITGASV